MCLETGMSSHVWGSKTEVTASVRLCRNLSAPSSLPCSLVENGGAADAGAGPESRATGTSWQTAVGNEGSWAYGSSGQMNDRRWMEA